MRLGLALLFILPLSGVRAAPTLTVLPEYVRIDPRGQIIPADRTPGILPATSIKLVSARAAYASCRLVVSLPTPGPYTLTVAGHFDTELHREWFHFLPSAKLYYPDALIPVASPYRAHMPDAENRIANHSVQSFWLDIWIPANAQPGPRSIITATLDANGAKLTLPVHIDVLDAIIPANDPIAIDHNSYGTSWFASQYPNLARRYGANFYLSDAFFALIHAYHRIFYAHRGVYHQLGYGHGGKVGPEFAPRLEGAGKTRRIADWTLYDKHYGPLLDGSAFASTRRGPRPIPFVYLPINPEWPASFLGWGEPGYEREFVNVVSSMESHFRDKGWTQTGFELFFNHKKRYKAFHWDGDETRFLKDMPFFEEYHRLLKLSVPEKSPVRFVFRTDVSWQMERQFKDLAGIINFWVCGGGMFGWYAENAPVLKRRGDIVWTYGGTPPIDKPSSHITTDLLRPWILGVDGFVRWQTVIPGPDPWFAFNGGGETLVYPGDRFGIDAPLPSIRLKIQRNALQDLALLDSYKHRLPPEQLRQEAAQRYNQTSLETWRSPRPAIAETNPEEWTNVTVEEATTNDPRFDAMLDAAAWERIHSWVVSFARGVRP